MSHKNLPRRLALVVLSAALTFCGPPSPPGPDLILTGGRIYVDGGPDRVVSAIAIEGDVVVATGADEDVRALAVEDTQEMPLDGAIVLPGFHDAWIDVEAAGRWSQGLDLSRAATPREIQARVREIAAGSGWIVGWGWDETVWPRPELPPADLLDSIVPDRPVLLYRRTGGLAWANRPALMAAGLEPAGGWRSDGAASGVIFGKALRQLEAVIPAPAPEQRREWIAAGLNLATAAGYTRVTTAPVGPAAVAAYQALERSGDLPLNVELRVDLEALTGALPALSGGRLSIVAAGLRLDGPLSPPLAALIEPYANLGPYGNPAGAGEPFSGILLNGPVEIAEACAAAERLGLRLDVQANGDLAVRAALDGCAALAAGNGLIVGADLLPAPAVSIAGARFAVVPFRMAHDLYWLEERLGSERARSTHPYRDLAATGSLAGMASLAPGYPLSPLAAALVMWTRRDLEGFPIDGWNGPQRVSVRMAVSALLSGPSAGLLETGQSADLVVWSEDPYSGEESSLRRARALLTLVAGRVTYSRPLRELPFDRQ